MVAVHVGKQLQTPVPSILYVFGIYNNHGFSLIPAVFHLTALPLDMNVKGSNSALLETDDPIKQSARNQETQ